MTPAERGLLIAIGQGVVDGTGRIRLLDMIAAVEREDARRPYHERMPSRPSAVMEPPQEPKP